MERAPIGALSMSLAYTHWPAFTPPRWPEIRPALTPSNAPFRCEMAVSALRRLLRRALTPTRPIDRRAQVPDDADTDLVVLGQEYLANDHTIHVLLEQDGRDTDDIPDFAPLADRQGELVGLIAGLPAQGFSGLLVKARAVRLRPFQVGHDSVTTLGWSLAGDVLRLFGDVA